MAKPEIINFDNINYAIYKVGTWKNHYEINQIGLSREIPVTNATLHHVKLSMEEIRKSEFDIDNKTVNGFVAIALQLNPKIQKMDTEDYLIFKLEKECHVTNSIPANLHTKKYYVDELKRIEKSLS